MFDNPFSPIFGGRPGMLFGRKDIVAKFENGMRVGGSHYKTLFITGARDMGKTTLLEHLSQMASAAGFKTIDAAYSNATRKLFRSLSGHDETAVSGDFDAAHLLPPRRASQ